MHWNPYEPEIKSLMIYRLTYPCLKDYRDSLCALLCTFEKNDYER